MAVHKMDAELRKCEFYHVDLQLTSTEKTSIITVLNCTVFVTGTFVSKSA